MPLYLVHSGGNLICKLFERTVRSTCWLGRAFTGGRAHLEHLEVPKGGRIICTSNFNDLFSSVFSGATMLCPPPACGPRQDVVVLMSAITTTTKTKHKSGVEKQHL